RDGVAEVAALELGALVDPSREEALAERAEGNEADAELLEQRQDLVLGLAPPERVFALQRRDRLDRVRTTDRPHTGFGESEVLHLALLDQLGDGAGDLFDRDVRVDPVL